MKCKFNGQIDIRAIRAERIQDADGTLSNKYLVLLHYSAENPAESFYSNEIYNADTAELKATQSFTSYSEAYFAFKARYRDYNGDDYVSLYGETRCNKQEALARYLDEFCETGRDITDFEADYKGSYKDAYDFVYNQINAAFEASQLIDLGVYLNDIDLQQIAARWFDSKLGKYSPIAIEKSYQNGFHVFAISPDPLVSGVTRKLN